ncbi:MAG: sigma-70 family RNA polymerase sigma factor [Phycisphaerales bacterium]|nr:sigma-70 family RNA polymerase sigma factor [Phycisphaerales bacterium]
MLISDEELLLSAKSGDRSADEAFHTLIDRHAAAMLRVANTLVPRLDAEDLLQETFLAAFRGLNTFEGRASVKTWLYAILFRQAANFRRKRGLPSLALSGDAPMATPSHTDTVDANLDLHAALARLPDDFRAILILRELDGLSYDEIATVLELPRGTVESRLHRARTALRKLL